MSVKLTPKQVAEMAKVGVGKIYEDITRGTLPAQNIGSGSRMFARIKMEDAKTYAQQIKENGGPRHASATTMVDGLMHYSLSKAAELIGNITPSGLRGRIERGRCKAIRQSGFYYIPATEIEPQQMIEGTRKTPSKMNGTPITQEESTLALLLAEQRITNELLRELLREWRE